MTTETPVREECSVTIRAVKEFIAKLSIHHPKAINCFLRFDAIRRIEAVLIVLAADTEITIFRVSLIIRPVAADIIFLHKSNPWNFALELMELFKEWSGKIGSPAIREWVPLI